MYSLLSREFSADKPFSRTVGVFVFIILTSLSGFVRIPLGFTPVPLTLQTFFVLLAGATLGSRLGAVSQLGYILFGALGLPVFSQGVSGCAYLAGPTAGYIFGFVAAAFIIGSLLVRVKGPAGVYAAFFAADLVILSAGALWLSLISGCSLGKAFMIGWLPFIAGDALKAAVAAGLYLRLRERFQRYF